MNRTRIEWCSYTWNVVVGCGKQCKDNNGKIWCYAYYQAKRQKQRCKDCYNFKPHIHIERLDEPKKVKKPSLIFADSMGDFWDKDVKQEWRDKVYKVMKETPQHTYFLLTKQPHRIKDTKKIPNNCFVGVSVTYFKDRWRIMQLISKPYIAHTFVSLEPLLDDNVSNYIYCVDWVIVGFLTGYKNGFKPAKKTVNEIIKGCRFLNVPLFLKNNVGWDKEIKKYPEFRGERRVRGEL